MEFKKADKMKVYGPDATVTVTDDEVEWSFSDATGMYVGVDSYNHAVACGRTQEEVLKYLSLMRYRSLDRLT